MNHKERVLTALDHQVPDRCPMQISFTPEFAERLRRDLRLDGGAMHNPHGAGNTYVLERALDEDMLLTSVGWANSYYGSERFGDGGETYTDDWGVGWRTVPYETRFGTGHYTEKVSHPLAEDAAIASYRPPDPTRPELYDDAAALLAEYGDDYWIVGVTVTTVLETATALRGYERILMDFVDNPDLLDALLEIPYHYHLSAARRLVQMGVDMVWIGDDVGGQDRMLISPRAWRRFLKPRMAEFIAALKALNPQVKVAYHSDGTILPIIPDLIEVGLDVLNPIQPACMDPAEVKRRFGQKLCFWGTIDEQHTLPFGTPGDVAREVRTRLETIGENGGLIIGPTHHVQLDTPLANFWAMVDTIRDTPYRGRG
jgi:uroporphyrinogen decarboxylase